MNSDVMQVIDQRQHTHGEFTVQGTWAQELKHLMRDTPNFSSLPGHQQEALEMIATKISRILHGDTAHVDTWADIGGYALLGRPNE